MARRIGRWFRSLISRASGSERWLPVDEPGNGYYNYRLMRFRAEGDLVRYPDYVWSSAGYWAARGGLSVHVEEVAERHDGVIYSDILVLLNREDRLRCQDRLVTPWEEQLQELVECQVMRLIEERGWQLAVPQRGVRVHVIGDGEVAMGGQPVGLAEGEFATALLPSLYQGPIASSRPLAEVFVRVPQAAGGRGGFRSVGTFYDDQLAFTVGRHWLDNGRVTDLPASALYTLHLFPGSEQVNHRLNADLADEYRLLRATSPQGESVQVQTRESNLTVMEVMLVSAEREGSSLADEEGARTGTIIPEDLAPGEGMTMIPEPEPEPTLVLSRRGVLLQKPLFAGVMRGYRLDIGLDGTIAPVLSGPASRLRVEDDRVYIEPLRRDVTLDGAPLRVGRRVRLDSGEHEIAFANITLLFRATDRSKDPRWPYLGEITVPAEPIELAMGSSYRIGRDRRKCEIALPDRAVNENILWHPAVDRGGTIRTRTGDVLVETFTTDSIMVAGQHAEIDLRGSEPKVRALSRACPVFIRRNDGTVVRMVAKEGATAQPLLFADDILIGNTLFRAILPTASQSATPPVPPSASRGGERDDPSPESSEHSEEHDPPASLSSEEETPAASARPEAPPPAPRFYGALPRALRKRIALPRVLDVSRISLDESVTVSVH